MSLDLREAEAFLYHEAACLDGGEWDAWLNLFADDAIFWVPAWKNETQPTDDPNSELSLIYYQGLENLRDRVWRARSGQSVASSPRARTVHLITNVRIVESDAAITELSSNFAVHLFDKRSGRTHAFFGRYTHRLARQEGAWKIVSKKALLLNDTIPTVLDFFHV